MADRAYLIVLEKVKDLLTVHNQSCKRVRAASVISQRFRMKSEGKNPTQHVRSDRCLWIVVEMATEIQAGRRSLQKFLIRPSNKPFKSRQVLEAFTMMTHRLNRQIEAEREASLASKVNNIQTYILRTNSKYSIYQTLLTSVIYQLERKGI